MMWPMIGNWGGQASNGSIPLWFLFLGVGENCGGRAAANPIPANTAHNQRTRDGPWGGNIEESEMRV